MTASITDATAIASDIDFGFSNQHYVRTAVKKPDRSFHMTSRECNNTSTAKHYTEENTPAAQKSCSQRETGAETHVTECPGGKNDES